MWPLQPTQGIPDRLAAALAALVVTGAVLTLILILTMGGRHEAEARGDASRRLLVGSSARGARRDAARGGPRHG